MHDPSSGEDECDALYAHEYWISLVAPDGSESTLTTAENIVRCPQTLFDVDGKPMLTLGIFRATGLNEAKEKHNDLQESWREDFFYTNEGR